jgi:hypothetical protein
VPVDVADGEALSLPGDFAAGVLGLFEAEEDEEGAVGAGDRMLADEDEDDEAASIVMC